MYCVPLVHPCTVSHWSIHVLCPIGPSMYCVPLVHPCTVSHWSIHVLCPIGPSMYCVPLVHPCTVSHWSIHVLCPIGPSMYCVPLVHPCTVSHWSIHVLCPIGPSMYCVPLVHPCTVSHWSIHVLYVCLVCSTSGSHVAMGCLLFSDSHKATQSTAGLPGQPSQAHLTTHLLSCKREPQEDTDSAPFWSQQRPGDQGEGCSPHATPPHRGPETPPTSSYGRNDASHDGGRLAWLRSGSTTPTSPSMDWTPLEELVDELTPVQSQLGPAPFPPSVWDRKRAELIRKSSAIYGGHLAKRRHLPLTAHEEDVNEASFQLCLRDPTLLVRRDELFLLARRAVKKRLGCANGGHGDPRGPQQCHGSGSPLLRAYPRGQKRPHPTTTTTTTTGNSCRGDQVDPSLKSCFREGGANVSSLGHTLMSIAGAPRGQVVPRPSDYTTLYTLPVWTDAAAAALRTATPTTLPLDPSMTIARRLQSLEDQGGHAHHLPMLGHVSREQEGGSPSSLEECNSAYLTSQVPVLRDLSPLHALSPSSSSSLFTSDARQLVEHVNRSANEAVQLLSSFTRVPRPHTRGYSN